MGAILREEFLNSISKKIENERKRAHGWCDSRLKCEGSTYITRIEMFHLFFLRRNILRNFRFAQNLKFYA